MFLKTLWKATKSFSRALPILAGVVLLLGLVKTYVSASMLTKVFSGNSLQDTFLGSAIGSIMAGNPINSYVIAGELLKSGISLFAVTAFLISWVTVGLSQLPMEIAFLGKRFALIRNLLSFFLSMLIAFLVVIVLGVMT